jgi:hypothetical protein
LADKLHLFAVLVGGNHPRALIELHDIQFVAARTLEETIPILRERWWGAPSSLHIDAFAEIGVVDGYRVSPVAAGSTDGAAVSLYFVNTGGYRDGVFGEEHAYSFHVGADKRAIWAAARERASFDQRHQDNFDPIDDVICIDDALAPQALRLRLDRTDEQDQGRIVARYMKLSS